MDVKKIDGINELMLGGRELRTTESKEENLPTEIANSAKKRNQNIILPFKAANIKDKTSSATKLK